MNLTDNFQRRTLGRGLSALLGENVPSDDVHPVSGDTFALPVHLVKPGRYQPRQHFDDTALQSLIDSIREKGIIQPLVVRPIPGDESNYEIIAGERRWRAAKTLGLDDVPVIIRPCSDREALETAIVENIQRDDLTPVEEAEAYQRLIDEFGYTQEELAKSVGKSRSHIANTLRLNNLSTNVKELIQSGKITAGHARTLLTAENPTALIDKILNEGLNVRDAERLSKEAKFDRGPSELDTQLQLLQEQVANLLHQRVTLKVNRSGAAMTIHFNSYEEIDDFLTSLRQTYRSQ